MAGCLDNIQIPKFEWLDLTEKRNAIASAVAGALFFTGWWIIIDIASHYDNFNIAFHVCGLFGTISLFMINAVSINQIREDSYTGGFLGLNGLRIWIFIGFVLGFSSIIAATWLLFSNYLLVDKQEKYPGVGLFLQNILVFASSLVFKFGRVEEAF